MRKIIISILILIGCVNCQPYRNTSISFGSGGGFANIQKLNTLSADGTLLREDGSSVKVSRADIKEIDKIAYTLTESYIHPSNTYLFMEIDKGGEKINYCWQFGDKNIDNNVVLLYSKLVKL